MARFAVYINLSYKSIRVVKWIECALRNVLLYVCTNRRSNLWQRLCSYTKKDILSIKNVPILKVIRKFFFKHNKSFRLHLEDYEKHNFLHLKACERRNFDFCVFLRMCNVTVSPRENNLQVFRYTTHRNSRDPI